jgi:CelD/BcsL family acetyltransferase involved in cellulose biosynthesis
MFARWEELHEADGGLGGPFLHPAYVRAVGEVRAGVEVGVITQKDEAVGFLPFQRSWLGVGGAVGSRLCDVAGAIVRPHVSWDPASFASTVGLRTLRLPNVPASMTEFAPFQQDGGLAPLIDLSGGFEAYRRTRLGSGSSFMSQLERKARKLEREVGPMRFEWHTTDDTVFDTLLSWKAAQRKQTRTPNILHLPWARALIERLRAHEGDTFGGVLSALYVGDTLAAAHFGLRTRRVLHYWIPAYSEELARYSPGVLALVELARAAAERGIQRIDLGSGEERYKLQAATGAVDMKLATVSTSAALRACTSTLDHARAWSRGSKLGNVVRRVGRNVLRASYRVQAALTSADRRAHATLGQAAGPGSAA